VDRRTVNALALSLAVVGGLLLIAWAAQDGSQGEGVSLVTSTPEPTATLVERLVPTLPATPPTPLPWTPRPTASSTPTRRASPTVSPSASPTASPTRRTATPRADPCATPPNSAAPTGTPTVIPAPASATPVPAATDTETPLPPVVPSGNRWRFGAVNRLGGLEAYDAAALNAGWFLTGTGGARVPPGTGLVYLVWVSGDSYLPAAETLQALVAAVPGAVWQIGNEPDVIWQSNCTPEQYARVYHQLYTLIKGADPTARVAAGSVSQPTPLRLQYLDLVLAAYQNLVGAPMPVDIWAVHNSILREERGSWGVDIPPGIGANVGRLYEIGDNDRLDIFQQQLIDFRVWMRDRGYQDRPVYLTEFSILMPAEYGFPPERVIAFMTGAFDYLLLAADGGLGYPADGHRLVQRWAWYSVADTSEWGHYPTGNLFDPVTKEMTAVGRAFAAYVAVH
jgi:hypothetical protein